MIFHPGQILTPWVDPRLETRVSPIHGKGAYALAPIKEGEKVLRWGGTVFTEDDLRAGKFRLDSAERLDDHLYLADPVGVGDTPDYFVNHCCNPNLWLDDAHMLTARRDIAAGEELTLDYALWEWNPDWKIDPCRCGATNCRRVITGSDWKLPELQERYRGHFSPYVTLLMTRLTSS